LAVCLELKNGLVILSQGKNSTDLGFTAFPLTNILHQQINHVTTTFLTAAITGDVSHV